MTDLFFTTLDGADVALVAIARSDQRAIVDAADAPLVAGRSWSMHNRGYVQTNLPRVDGVGRVLLMHHLILRRRRGLQIDHVNGAKLDNRRVNLRLATPSQNQANSRARTGFKGVSLNHTKTAFRARITVMQVEHHLGTFDTDVEAAHAYDTAALAAFGEFARVNFAKAAS